MSKISKYRLKPWGEVIDCLSKEQRQGLYGNNIFLIVDEYITKGGKEAKRGVLTALDHFNKPILVDGKPGIRIRKKIDDLLLYAYPGTVDCLPEPLEAVNFTWDNWNYGDRVKKRIAGKIRTLEVAKYFNTGRIQYVNQCFI